MFGRALQGQADEGDGNAVELPDLVGRKHGLAGALLDRGGGEIVKFGAEERMRPLAFVDRDDSRRSASAAVRPCPRRIRDCRPRPSRAPSSTAIRWWARRETSPTGTGWRRSGRRRRRRSCCCRPSRSCLTSVAMCSAPPAGTVIFLVLSSGSAILMPPGGGSRLPWKSLIARMRSSTGALCAACAAATWAERDQPASQRAREGSGRSGCSHDFTIEPAVRRFHEAFRLTPSCARRTP